MIASLDKDLKTIPGVHIERGGLIDISQYEADHAFYMQVLSGDASDGYPGCPGVGPKRAADILKNAKTSEEMWAATLEAYEKKHLSREYALQMARCARILRLASTTWTTSVRCYGSRLSNNGASARVQSCRVSPHLRPCRAMHLP